MQYVTGYGQNVELFLFRIILVVGFIAVPLFGYLAQGQPDVIDYPLHRWILGGTALSIAILSFFSRKVRKNIISFTCWWLFLDHLWVTWIVYVNSFDIVYYSGLLTSFCALIIAIRKPGLFYIFSLSGVLLALFSAWFCPSPKIPLSMIVFTMIILSTAFILTNLAILSFQNSLHHRNLLLEKEVETRAAIAEHRASQLASKNKELEQFAYIASHDLKSPLRNIGGFAQLLQKRLKDSQAGEVNDYIDFIVTGVKKMNNVIEDILLYSRFGEGATKFKLEPIAEIIQDAFAVLQWEIQEKHAIVYMDGVEGSLFCDRSQMVQLFQNLVSNAVKYNTSSRPLIKICMTNNTDHFLFSVKDNGIGIPQEHQERVFKMFQRLHTDHEFSGTGIGLAICQRIVENHRGKIWIRSSKDAGTKFFFTIHKNLERPIGQGTQFFDTNKKGYQQVV